jgi:hypothetical protein
MEKQLDLVKKITNRVDPNVCSNVTDVLKVNSYVLLSHAAFEKYLENLVEIIMTKSVLNYSSTNGVKVNKCIISMLSKKVVSCYENAASLSKTKKKEAINKEMREVSLNTSDKLGDAQRLVLSILRRNHGIKIDNMNTIFNCIGVYPEEIDVSLCSDLDSFGASRGGVAHVVQIQQVISKSQAIANVKNIKGKLLAFERSVMTYMNF